MPCRAMNLDLLNRGKKREKGSLSSFALVRSEESLRYCKIGEVPGTGALPSAVKYRMLV